MSNTASALQTLVWDQSPDQIGGSLTSCCFTNETPGQNFADIVRFDTQVQLTGMDIFMHNAFPSLGDTGTVRIRTGSHLGPLIEFAETVSLIDNDGTATIGVLDRVHVDFTNPVALLAGVDYWIGLSGTSTNWVQAGITGGTGPLLDNQLARYFGTTFIVFATDVDDQTLRHRQRLSVSDLGKLDAECSLFLIEPRRDQKKNQ